MYGESGSGVAERDGVADRVDIIQGTMGKAIGVVGGRLVRQPKTLSEAVATVLQS